MSMSLTSVLHPHSLGPPDSPMPECREGRCHHQHFTDCHEELKKQDADLKVVGIWADAGDQDKGEVIRAADQQVQP